MPPTQHADIPPLREAFQQFLRLLRLIRSYWGPLGKGMVLGLVLGLLGMVTPYLSKLLIDEVYPTRNLTLMEVLVLGILAVSVASSVMSAIRSYFTTYTTSHLANATSLLFFNHLQHLRTRFFDEHRVGEIISRFADVRNSLNSVSRVFETLFVNGVYLFLVPPFLFLLQWKLAIVSLITVPLTVIITTMSARLLRRFWKKSAEAYADLGAFQVEVLSHIRTLKAMSMEHAVYERARSQIQAALQVQLKAGGWSQVFGTLTSVVRALGTAVFTWYGWTLIVKGEMTLGDYIAFTAYMGYLYNPLQQITGLFSDFQQTAVNLGRMFEYLDMPLEQDPANAYQPHGAIQHVIEGDIRLRDVSFGYSAEKRVLHDVTLHFARGGITAIVGPSGAGKSSLLRLVTRMEEPDSGQVFVDGSPVTTFSMSDLRRQVSVVWQEFSLMQGTIWDNLTLGAEKVSRAAVDDAVRLCRLDSLVADLPQGYETSVAEWGATLSGGQRQRMALARALVRDTPVLLLDEATSNIDMQTETEILRDLFGHMEGKTIIFVTHRVQTAALADQICVIEAGRVVGVGTHAELIRDNETYRLLHGGGNVDEVRRLRAVPQTV
ncbi:ABC transporter ATP-binding protein [Longimicrobium sp.]|uniref:ABC transporter ATP-binding protein n=1 Tax=Longimicrobium sp. TaxID=2029185 RepID=UPI002CDEF68A|nr:ABC transporter ATP-binding protein [Longimicrobium sp.]HSU13175.1 ABC transporter ATP-binding protein [Longimicrobium sp.]